MLIAVVTNPGPQIIFPASAPWGAPPSLLKSLTTLLLAAASLALSPLAGAEGKPIVYNDMEGDGGAAIDLRIKAAYGTKYTIVDTAAKAGYTGPEAVAGAMPKSPKTEFGPLLGGYVLVVYLVSFQGLVADPVERPEPGVAEVPLPPEPLDDLAAGTPTIDHRDQGPEQAVDPAVVVSV